MRNLQWLYIVAKLAPFKKDRPFQKSKEGKEQQIQIKKIKTYPNIFTISDACVN